MTRLLRDLVGVGLAALPVTITLGATYLLGGL